MTGTSRRVFCGSASWIGENAMMAVPVIPAFFLVEPAVGRVKVRGILLTRKHGTIRAFANLCRHVPLTLDLGDGEVRSADNQFFLCHHHGARFRLDTGACISGPCLGESLFPLEICIENEELFVILPSDEKKTSV